MKYVLKLRMSRYDSSTIWVLIKRDLMRFFRQRSRIAGALIQPLLFWVILGSGFAHSFQVNPELGVSYLEYFYPGVICMMVLFTAIFATMSVIEDRNEGFLQAVISAPSSRAALVLGKVLGGTLVALIQVSLFLLLFPLAGFHLSEILWFKLFLILFLTAFGLNSFGFYLAWWLNSVQGYHAIMSIILIPLWMLSGAMFPLHGASKTMHFVMSVNPLAYCLEGIRSALYGNSLPSGLGLLNNSLLLQFFVICLFAILTSYLAIQKCQKTAV